MEPSASRILYRYRDRALTASDLEEVRSVVAEHYARGRSDRGKEQENWNPDYRLMSDAVCKEDELWHPVIDLALDLADDKRPIYSAQDDTKLARTGREIPDVAYGRDPKSPPFHVNLTLGHRFLGTSVMARGEGENRPSRSIPVGFRHAPRPGHPKG